MASSLWLPKVGLGFQGKTLLITKSWVRVPGNAFLFLFESWEQKIVFFCPVISVGSARPACLYVLGSRPQPGRRGIPVLLGKYQQSSWLL